MARLLALCFLIAVMAGCTAESEEDVQEESAPVEEAAETEAPEMPEEPVQAAGSALIPGTNDDLYLEYFFGISLAGEVTAGEFEDALEQITGEAAAISGGELTVVTGGSAAVTAAGFEELALTYTDEKAEARLAAHGVEGVDAAEAARIACALDTGLLSADEVNGGGVLTAEGATALLMRVAEATGSARNALGSSSDPEIYDRLNNAWASFLIFDDPELTELGKTAVEQSVTTGYNLKHEAYGARFLPELTMQYGHSDIRHAHQLLGLLAGEDITVLVQLEPKVSVYQYLLEWGPVPDPVPGYEVREFDGELYLAFALEYDLLLEFETEEDFLRFDGIIEEYAKKNEGNEEGEGLLYGSWWQPLYSATVEIPDDAYYMIYDCVVYNGDYSIHPFCLAEDFEFVVDEFSRIAPDMEVEPVVRYCNTAFYNYMSGVDYQ